MTRKNIKKILLNNREIFETYKIKRLGIFGSYLSGKNKNTSDIDILVEFNETTDLFEFVHLINELQKLLKIKVDLVTPGALKPYMKEKILKEVDWFEKI